MKKGLNRPLRKGYTTGACAAAAAKAAAVLLLKGRGSRVKGQKAPSFVEIPFPDNSRVKFKIHKSKLIRHNSEIIASASVIKDAGDDPDITNGAEIAATVSPILRFTDSPILVVKGGKGVGVVTKPGLAVPVGQPAINPVPMKMIKEAVMEAVKEGSRVKGQGSRVKSQESLPLLEITISVPKGKELAKKTLNSRLGIIGGISILGTTGIVEPMSVDAYKDTISLGIDMAVAAGLDEIVFTPGRNSEKYAEEILQLKEEAFVQMGDYAGFAFETANKKGIKRINVAGQLGKMAKVADGNFKTHVRDSVLSLSHIAEWAEDWGYDKAISKSIRHSNTARQISDFFEERGDKRFFELLGKRVIEKIKGLLKRDIEIRCIILSSNGVVMADVKGGCK